MTSESPTADRQISLRDLLWTTTALALLLAYARTLGASAISQATLYLLMVLTAATVVGGLAGQFKNALYWSAVIALLAFLAVAGGRLPNAWVMLGWGAVGAGCGAVGGAYAGSHSPRTILLGCLTSALLGLLLMLLTLWISQQAWTDLLLFDVVCAGLVGLLLWPFIQYLRVFQRRSAQSPVLLAAWLTMSVLIGNFLVPILAGVAR